MSAVVEKRRQVAERQKADYEAYNLFEYEKLLRNELTDQAERIKTHMVHSFAFTYGEGEKLYSEHDELFETILDDGILEAQREAATDPINWGFELERRLIEREELLEVQALEHDEKLVIFSPIPDEVLSGQTNLNGYNRKRKKMMARIAERKGDDVEILYFSLDGSNYGAMQAAARNIGVELPDGLTAEEVLAHRFHFDHAHELSLEDCYQLIVAAYDTSMVGQYGGRYHAGRRDGISEESAMNILQSIVLVQHPGDLEEHMKAVQEIMARLMPSDKKQKELEEARYNFAAAIDRRRRGVEIDSISDAGDDARDAGEDFSGDCATGSSATSSSTSSAAEMGMAQGKNKEMKCVQCPLPGCGKTVDAIVGKDTIGCPQCKRYLNTKTGKIGNFESSREGLPLYESVFEMIERITEENRREKIKKEKEKRKRELGKEVIKGLREDTKTPLAREHRR